MRITNHKVYYSSVIVIESRLEQCYYDYSSGKEELAFDRIAETICDLANECEINEKIEVYLDEAIRVNETTAAKISRQLMIIVNGLDTYKDPKKSFRNDILMFATDLTKRIANTANWQTRIETGGNCIIVNPNNKECSLFDNGVSSSPLTPP